MFYSCKRLTTIDLTPLNTSNVTSMSDMFYGCRGLTSLDLTPLDTSNVTDMSSMFDGCRGLVSLDLTPWIQATLSIWVPCSAIAAVLLASI